MRGIDTFILGDVLHFCSDSKNYPSRNTVRVQIDTRIEENPAFREWQFLHANPTEQQKKTAPPMMMERPVYKLYTYETGTPKIISLIEIAYKPVDTLSGENLFTDTISGKLTKQDSYHHGLPAANVSEDPLELPAEVEVLDELMNQKVSEVGLSVLRHFQSLELEYFNEGEKQLKRRQYEEAIERFTDAIFDERLKRIGKSTLQEILRDDCHIGSVEEPQFVKIGPKPGRKRAYVVTAVDRDGLESEPSQPVTVLGR